MTFKYWLIDKWLTFVHGRWEVKRIEVSAYDTLVRMKNEGAELHLPPDIEIGVTNSGALKVTDYAYYACNKRTQETILCPSKREAESCCAFWNDMRSP